MNSQVHPPRLQERHAALHSLQQPSGPARQSSLHGQAEIQGKSCWGAGSPGVSRMEILSTQERTCKICLPLPDLLNHSDCFYPNTQCISPSFQSHGICVHATPPIKHIHTEQSAHLPRVHQTKPSPPAQSPPRQSESCRGSGTAPSLTSQTAPDQLCKVDPSLSTHSTSWRIMF